MPKPFYLPDLFFRACGIITTTLNTMFADKHSTLTVALSHLSMAIGEFVSLSDQQLIMIRVQAGCLLVILPPMLIYFFVQKKFTEGIERSGIVG